MMINNTHVKRSALTLLCSITALPNMVLAAEYSVYGKAEVQIAKTDTGVMRYADEGTQIRAIFTHRDQRTTHT